MQKKRFIKDYLELLIITVLIALFIRAFVVQAFEIPSSSMEPTLLIGDYLLINKFTYGIRIPYTDFKFFQFKKPRRGTSLYSSSHWILRRTSLKGSSE